LAASAKGSPKVLVIEDDLQLLRALSYYLQRRGLEVVEATDGESGLAAYHRERPAALVLDNSLPNKMGYEICREVRQHGGGQTPIIMVSAFMKVLGVEGEREEEEELVDAFLRKPFQLEQLWKTLERMRTATGFARPKRSDGGASAVETGEPGPGLPLEGSCAQMPVVELMARALAHQATGILTLKEDNRIRRLYFANGFPAFARSNLITESLLRYLLRMGEIDAETYRRHLSRMQQERWRPGATLVREGAISLTKLNRSHRALVEEIIQLSFDWQAAQFSFTSTTRPLEQAVVYDINPFRMVDRWLEHSFSATQLLDRVQGLVDATIAPSSHLESWYHLLVWAFQLDSGLEQVVSREGLCFDALDIPTEQRPLRARLLQTFLLMGAMDLRFAQPSLQPERLLRALMRTEAENPQSGAPATFAAGAPASAQVSGMMLRPSSDLKLRPLSSPGMMVVDIEKDQRDHQQIRRIYDVVLRDYRRVSECDNPYEALRVARSDSLDVIRRRYERFERFYRPENFQRLGDSKLFQLAVEIRQALARSMAEIEAFNNASSSMLGTSMGGGTSEAFGRGASWFEPAETKDPLAHIFFNDALTYLRLGDLDEGEHHFRRAVEAEPANSMYQAYVIWTTYLKAGRSREAGQSAQDTLNRLVERYPSEDTAFHFLAHIFREEGDLEKAVIYYRKAAELNPDNRSARLFLKRLSGVED